MDSVSTKLQAKFQAPGYEKAAMDSRTLQRKNPTSGSLCGRNQNRCVVYLANPCMVAESVDRRGQSWFFRTDVESDMIVQVGESIFHLHKIPMVSRSACLNRLVFERKRSHLSPNIQIDSLPGGTKIFELVAKFCYGWKVDLTAKNIAPLYCAAHFLEMSDDLEEGNLVSQTESFLNFLILSSWKDTFRIFKSCESISLWARELHILKRCSEAVAWRACSNHKNEAECLSALPDRANNRSSENAVDGWWFEDVVFLRIDHFIEVIGSLRKKGMKPKLVGSCIAHWTAKWLSKIKFGVETANTEEMTLQLQKVNVESLIRILPVEEGSVSIKVLLHLLKIGLVMKIGPELLNNLEERIVSLLENICAKDLLVKNYKPGAAAYDVAIVAKVLESYLLFVSSEPSSRISVIGRLLDEYLTLVARDENLPPQSFQLLVEALPRNARYCDDNLYRAIDMYLKAHPGVTEEERCSMCRGMEYQKLSQEARKHAMKNDRLPVNIITRFILLEQVDMTRSITAAGSKYQRTKSQAIIRIGKGAGKGGMMGGQKEIKTMKQDVERIKVQISDLQQHRVDLQRQVRRQKFGFVRSSLMC
ncbi:root phototropism protein 3-like isoform X2 [Diospyros lotus]|uniref:root phototropism protein 3-like isoform X2 n=1 Tax=Diospyros lotus TaxID=55363 RepID=UPI002251901C|nr:root phototropism protein 3-like isoform X2 [Diospyros lotus]